MIDQKPRKKGRQHDVKNDFSILSIYIVKKMVYTRYMETETATNRKISRQKMNIMRITDTREEKVN